MSYYSVSQYGNYSLPQQSWPNCFHQINNKRQRLIDVINTPNMNDVVHYNQNNKQQQQPNNEQQILKKYFQNIKGIIYNKQNNKDDEYPQITTRLMCSMYMYQE